MAFMLHNILIAICLTLCVAACATSPATSGTGRPRAAAKEPPAGCVADTATRIPVSPSDCVAFGSTFTYKDVKSTGETDAAQALRQLDPTVTVTH
jgi:hypothetical protein